MNIEKSIVVAATNELLEMVDGLDFAGVLTDEELEKFYSLIILIKSYLSRGDPDD